MVKWIREMSAEPQRSAVDEGKFPPRGDFTPLNQRLLIASLALRLSFLSLSLSPLIVVFLTFHAAAVLSAGLPLGRSRLIKLLNIDRACRGHGGSQVRGRGGGG